MLMKKEALNEMGIAYFMAACAGIIMAGSGYYWYKERKNSESRKIYRIFFVAALILLFGSIQILLPESVLVKYSNWLYLIWIIFIVFIA